MATASDRGALNRLLQLHSEMVNVRVSAQVTPKCVKVPHSSMLPGDWALNHLRDTNFTPAQAARSLLDARSMQRLVSRSPLRSGPAYNLSVLANVYSMSALMHYRKLCVSQRAEI